MRNLSLLLPLSAALGCGAVAAPPSPSPPLAPAPPAAVIAAQEAASSAPVSAPACAARSSGALSPVGEPGGTVALARAGDRTLALVADEATRALRVVDADARVELASTPLAGAPAAVLVLADGRVAVALRDVGQVAVLEPEPGYAPALDARLSLRCSVSVAAEPVALAQTPGGASVLVASRWGHALTALDASSFERRFVADLPRDPAAVVSDSTGKKAFVAHLVGSKVSVVDLEGEHAARTIDLHVSERRETSSGMMMMMDPEPRFERVSLFVDQLSALVRAPGGKILAPGVSVNPGNGVRTSGYGPANTVTADLAQLAEADEKRLDSPSDQFFPEACLLPRAAAFDPVASRLLVACAGPDAVIAHDATSAFPRSAVRRRWKAGAGLSGIAVDAERRRAVAFASFDRQLTVIPLDEPANRPLPAKAIVALAPAPIEAELARGRAIFHTAGAHAIAADGRVCASCHPDGRDDGLTWTTPDGPRQTPILVGRLAGTEPYGWDGAHRDLSAHLTRTFERLGGRVLGEADRRAVLAYVGSLGVPASAPGAAADHLARGAAIFESAETGCATCHGGSISTDRQTHDVESRSGNDRGPLFDTPSLRFVGQSAPYFHDGRYPTLDALLDHADGTMGRTRQLSPGDRAALLAYLGSL